MKLMTREQARLGGLTLNLVLIDGRVKKNESRLAFIGQAWNLHP